MVDIKGTPKSEPRYGSNGNDTIQGLAGDDRLFGLAGADRLEGDDGNDYLVGGKGSDRLEGGTGNDTYEVERKGDRIVETSNQGIDLVESSITFTLSSNLENLDLKGSGNINGTGNASTNVLRGNSGRNRLEGMAGDDRLDGGSGDDTLDGGLGRDILFGGSGNNIFRIDNVGDRIESAGPGVDTVISEVGFVLGNDLDNLFLSLSGKAILGKGNKLANFIVGNGADNQLSGLQGSDTLWGQDGRDLLTGGPGQDKLSGGNGNDTLIGGRGGDQFIFRESAVGSDTIKGFKSNTDVIQLKLQTFELSSTPGVGFSNDSEFAVVRKSKDVAKSLARIIFNQKTGALIYNPNIGGPGLGNDQVIAIFKNTNTLSSFDFILTSD